MGQEPGTRNRLARNRAPDGRSQTLILRIGGGYWRVKVEASLLETGLPGGGQLGPLRAQAH
jgi:hypothetical protein